MHEGLVALLLLELDVACLKRIYLHYTCPEKAFLLMLGGLLCVLNLLYVSLDTAPPLYRCVSLGEGEDEGQKTDPRLDLWIQLPWNFGNV